MGSRQEIRQTRHTGARPSRYTGVHCSGAHGSTKITGGFEPSSALELAPQVGAANADNRGYGYKESQFCGRYRCHPPVQQFNANVVYGLTADLRGYPEQSGYLGVTARN
ncbi:hypothetical protein [Paraburkholderia terrae]|uniref:hypothetical protein n=1 Tax=Paraburkholderia terrae TaxID=311230 RepID=UPI001EE35542|nr:hypothetical protein [Paraburkholderia terrae]GJH02778.1 hypothetical protein CBA19C8_19495 [Paraburkholderia terrae]